MAEESGGRGSAALGKQRFVSVSVQGSVSPSLFLSSQGFTSPSAPAKLKNHAEESSEGGKNLQTHLHFNEFLIEPKSVVFCLKMQG